MGFEFVRVGHVIERHLRTVNATKDISLLIGGREKRMSAEVRFNTGVDSNSRSPSRTIRKTVWFLALSSQFAQRS